MGKCFITSQGENVISTISFRDHGRLRDEMSEIALVTVWFYEPFTVYNELMQGVKNFQNTPPSPHKSDMSYYHCTMLEDSKNTKILYVDLAQMVAKKNNLTAPFQGQITDFIH